MDSVRKTNLHGDPRPARTLLLFEAVIQALDEKIQVISRKHNSEYYDENTQATWLTCFKLQLESSVMMHQRYSWVLGQRENASAREMQLLFGNTDASQLLSATGEHKKTMASTLQAIREEMIQLDEELFAVEQRLESEVLGWLECTIHGLAGFARLSPGSLFRLILKHADQRWESRIANGKNNKQFLENDTHRFRIVLDYSLGIKAEEERSIGGSPTTSISTDSFFRSLVPKALVPYRLIGTVNFDVLPLISALPQLLTISLNSSGSIKLHIVVKWLPPPPPSNSSPAGNVEHMAYSGTASIYSFDSTTYNNAISVRQGRKSTGTSPKYGKGTRTIRQPKSMSINPKDINALLAQMGIENGGTNEPNEYEFSGSSSSPISSINGSSSLKNQNQSPRSAGSDVETTPRYPQQQPGAGMDRIRALALHDLNDISNAPNRVSEKKTIIIEPENSQSIPIQSIQQPVNKKEIASNEELLTTIQSFLDELRNCYSQVGEFEKAFHSVRDLLVPKNMPRSKSVGGTGLAPRPSPVRQSIRRRKNHQDLQVNVEPSTIQCENRASCRLPRLENSGVKNAGFFYTNWPELDSAIISHFSRSCEDLNRLSLLSNSSVKSFAEKLVLASLQYHTLAINEFLVPLISAQPNEKPEVVSNSVAMRLHNVDSKLLWSNLGKTPAGLISISSSVLRAELLKKLKGIDASDTVNHPQIADFFLNIMLSNSYESIYAYLPFFNASVLNAPAVVTLWDFAAFCGEKSVGLLEKLKEIVEIFHFCSYLEEKDVDDESLYNTIRNVVNRSPSLMISVGLARALQGRHQPVIASALKSASFDWWQGVVMDIGTFVAFSNPQVKELASTTKFLISLLSIACQCSFKLKHNVTHILSYLALNDVGTEVQNSAKTTMYGLGCSMPVTLIVPVLTNKGHSHEHKNCQESEEEFVENI